MQTGEAMTSRAILIIDMQRGLVSGCYRETELVETVNQVIHRGRAAGAPVIFVQHNHATFEPMKRGARGWQIDDRLDRQIDDLTIEKEACDAFFETELENELQSRDVAELIVTGLQTEFCVDTTCRAALSRGFDLILVEDGHSTGNSHLGAAEIVDHHNRTLAAMVHPRSTVQVLMADAISFDD
jgi:nicotinamidase-related amidase